MRTGFVAATGDETRTQKHDNNEQKRILDQIHSIIKETNNSILIYC